MWLSVCLFACLVVCLFGFVLFCFVCLFMCLCVRGCGHTKHASRHEKWRVAPGSSRQRPVQTCGRRPSWKGMVCDRCLAKAAGCVCVCLCVCLCVSVRVCQLLCSKDFTGANFLRFCYFATIQHARNSQ